ncbi:hypothetical protein KJ554_00025, partial [bacterium]|nr:hypothetical protein [bacterium]
PAAAGAAPPPGAGEKQRLREAFERNMREGDLEMARTLIGEMLRFEPANPLLHYNAACVAARAGEPGEAMASLRQAVASGYDDVRTLEADADLTILRGTAAYEQIIGDLVADLLDEARRERVALVDGAWRGLGRLEDRASGAGISLDMMFDDDGFHVRATGPAGVMRPAGADARGGELLVTLTAPDSARSFDTRRAWRFGFGSSAGEPRGRLLGLPGQPLHQRVLELAPSFAAGPAPDTITLAADMPWAYLAPYSVPADTLFGVNIGHTGPGRFTQLVRDPAMADAAALWHRFRPVTVALGGSSAPRLAARVPNALVGATPVTIELAAWSSRGGEAILTMDVTDREGNSVVGSGDTATGVVLQPGLNTWTRHADLSSLPDGPYRLSARLDPTGDRQLSCRIDVLRFDSLWLSRTRDRTKPLSHLERPSLDWRLGLIADGLAGRDPRTYPAPLWTTVAEVETLLARHAQAGTILPARGLVTIACPVGDGRLFPQTLAFRPGWEDEGTGPLLVVLDAGGWNAPDLMPALAGDAAARSAFSKLGGVAARPGLPAAVAGTWDADTWTAARAALTWLRDRFPDRPMKLAAIDGSSSAADLRGEYAATVRDAVSFAPGGDTSGELLAWLAEAP